MTDQHTAAGAERGEATRRRLVEAGLEAFGRHGYEAVSTRQLAERAGVNLAAIPYHFGGKEGVYLAVARHIVDTLGARIRPAADGVREALDDGGLDDGEALARLEQLIRTLALQILGAREAGLAAGFVFREQMQPTDAFGVLYEGFMRPVHETLSLLVARLLGLPPDSGEAVLRTHTILGQVIAFRVAREAILRRMGWTELDAGAIERIASLVSEQVRAALQPAGET